MKLPETLMIGSGNSTSGTSALDTLINLLTVEKAKAVASQK
jgi:hypothetical protein